MRGFGKVLKYFSLFLLIVLVAGAAYLFDLFKDDHLPILKGEENPYILNGLLVGYDAGVDGIYRPDSIFLFSIDLRNKALGIISIPRDTRVAVPGYNSKYKINSTYGLGGIKLFTQAIEGLVNVPIHCYLGVDFDSFLSIVEIIGGVEIEVKEHMHYVDEAGGLYIDIKPGRQLLQGETALNYVRYREPALADIGRIKRQQVFINAMVDRLFSLKMLPKLPSLLAELKDLFDTNLSFKDMARLGKIGMEFPQDRIEMAIIPGVPEYINGVSFWVPDHEAIENLSLSLILTKDYLENANYKLSILNGSGITGQAAEISSSLQYWGFNIQDVGNADSFDYLFTTIFYGEGGLEGALRVSSIIGGVPKKNDDLAGNELKIILGQDQSASR